MTEEKRNSDFEVLLARGPDPNPPPGDVQWFPPHLIQHQDVSTGRNAAGADEILGGLRVSIFGFG